MGQQIQLPGNEEIGSVSDTTAVSEQPKSKIIIVSTRPPLPPISGGMAPAVLRACDSFDDVVWYAIDNPTNASKPFRKATTGQGPMPGSSERIDLVCSTVKHNILVKALQVVTGIWDAHANRFSNQWLWPHLHGHHHRAKLVDDTDSYGNFRVNDLIAQAIAHDLGDDCTTPIWIHDYPHFHLPSFLRQHGVKNPIVFFNHATMPDPAQVAELPDTERGMLKGTFRALLHCDAALFQTGEDARRVMAFLGVKNPSEIAPYQRRKVEVPVGTEKKEFEIGHYPISIDTPAVMKTAQEAALSADGRALADQMVAPFIFINFERCDYSKGILQRLLAFEKLLTRHPELQGKAQIVIGAEPSRTDIAEYTQYAAQARKIAERINARSEFQCGDKPPVLLQYKNTPHDDVLLLLRNRQPGQRMIGTVTGYSDGKNLFSEEFAAAQDPNNAGVLILSSGAGSAPDLALDGRGALIYDARAREMDPHGHFHTPIAPPDDSVDAITRAMLEAVRMPPEEANRRCLAMQETLIENDLHKWTLQHKAVFADIAQERALKQQRERDNEASDLSRKPTGGSGGSVPPPPAPSSP